MNCSACFLAFRLNIIGFLHALHFLAILQASVSNTVLCFISGFLFLCASQQKWKGLKWGEREKAFEGGGREKLLSFPAFPRPEIFFFKVILEMKCV